MVGILDHESRETQGTNQNIVEQSVAKPQGTDPSTFAFDAPQAQVTGSSAIDDEGPATLTAGRSTTAFSSAPQELPPPVAQATGIMWNATGRRPQAPLRIETSAGANYYVKLVDAQSGAAAIAFFVEGGRPLEVAVPLGSYRFRYASGETWRGEESLFGPGDLTGFFEAGDRFDFAPGSGYTVQLILQTGGNLSTRSISQSQF